VEEREALRAEGLLGWLGRPGSAQLSCKIFFFINQFSFLFSIFNKAFQ
jgi:hypothetical protein